MLAIFLAEMIPDDSVKLFYRLSENQPKGKRRTAVVGGGSGSLAPVRT